MFQSLFLPVALCWRCAVIMVPLARHFEILLSQQNCNRNAIVVVWLWYNCRFHLTKKEDMMAGKIPVTTYSTRIRWQTQSKIMWYHLWDLYHGHIGGNWMLSAHPMQGNPRQSLILDSISWIPDSKYWIPIVSGIPESKAQDSRFHE